MVSLEGQWEVRGKNGSNRQQSQRVSSQTRRLDPLKTVFRGDEWKKVKPVIERHVRRGRFRTIITVLYAALYIKVRSFSPETVIAINVHS